MANFDKDIKLKYQKLIGMPPSPLSKVGGEQVKYWTLSDGEMVTGGNDGRTEQQRDEKKIEIQTEIVQNQLEPELVVKNENESPP